MRKNKRNVAEIAVDVELKLEHLELISRSRGSGR